MKEAGLSLCAVYGDGVRQQYVHVCGGGQVSVCAGGGADATCESMARVGVIWPVWDLTGSPVVLLWFSGPCPV